MSGLSIELLGVPVIRVNDQPIEFSRRKSLALVAYLAATGNAAHRDSLAALFFPELDAVRARAGLRRVLSAISETPAVSWLIADRETIDLRRGASVWVDLDDFERLAQKTSVEDLSAAAALYRDHFMAGFTLKDSPEHDEWLALQTQAYQQKFLYVLERLAVLHMDAREYERALSVTRRWLAVDPLHEIGQFQLMRLYALTGHRSAALSQYEAYSRLLANELGAQPSSELTELYDAILRDEKPPNLAAVAGREQTSSALMTTSGNLPALPRLVVGREQVLDDLTQRLANHREAVLQGLPGIGKTTLTAQLAHDGRLRESYPDGVLWTSLGETPNLLNELLNWSKMLGLSDLGGDQTIEQTANRLGAALRDKRMLLIVDDIWEVEHAEPFRVGSAACAMLMTTRANDLARALASRTDLIYKVPLLSDEAALELMRALAPEVVAAHPDAMLELARDLEGLPLALQVAARLLHAEMALGWGVEDLLAELREGARLLEAHAPSDRAEMARQTTPTVRALLQRSIDRLSADLQERFAVLGVFAPKPATFSLEAIQAVWGDRNPKPAIKALVDRGLLEPVGGGIFQMHALLVMQARALFDG
jgi:DNA-binding SARP family transcriptional activator